MDIIYFFLLTVTLPLWAMWYLYIIVIGLYHVYLQKKLSKTALVLGFPAILVGAVLDWLINIVLATVWFLDLPKSPFELLTTRLSRYMKTGTKRQKKHANSICRKLLDVFDPNPEGHCR